MANPGTKRINLDVGPEFDALLDRMATAEGLTKAEVIRRAVAIDAYNEAKQGEKSTVLEGTSKALKTLTGKTMTRASVPADLYEATGLAGPGGEVVQPPPSFTQRAGLQLAIAVGSLILAVTLLITLDWSCRSPAMPSTNSTDPIAIKGAIENYKLLSDAANDRAIKLFEAIVVKALLPVFTAILGYIFGTRTSSNGSAT